MSSNFRLHDVFHVVFRHKWKMGFFFASILMVTWAALIVWPREYESEVKLMVRVGRESVSLDPTATTSQTLMLQKSQEDEINSALDILNSRHMAELVVEQLGPDYILNEKKTGGEDSRVRSAGMKLLDETVAKVGDFIDRSIAATRIRDDISDHEMAVRHVQKNATIHAPKNSTVITIHYRAKDPQVAQTIASEITDTYLHEHVRVSRTPGSWEFFDGQSTLLARRLHDKIAEMSKFRKEHSIVSIPVNQELLKEQLSAVQSELRRTMVDVKRADAEVALVRSQLSEIEPNLISSTSGSADPTWSAMRQRIFELEVQEKELSAKYTDDHPLVRNVRSQLKAVQDQFDDSRGNRRDSTVAPNPIAQALTQQLLSAEAQAEGMRSSLESLETQRAEYLAKLDKLIEQEAHLAELEREVAVLEANYRSHQEKLEEARIITALQEERISNVNVAQPATFVERPINPNKKVVAALALFLGLAGAIGLAFFCEAMDPTLRTREQTEAQLQLPVLSTIPAKVRRRDFLKSLNKGTKHDAFDINCKSLLQQILYSEATDQEASTTLGVLSCNSGNEGSTLAAQLAIVASRDMGLSTLLIDTDNEQKFVTRAFRLNGAPGLGELLSNEAAEADCIQRISAPNFAVISSAAQDRLGAIQLDPRNVGTRLKSLKRQYDLVIVDLPSAAASGDGVSLAGLMDHVLLVVEAEKTVGVSAQRVRAQLLRSNAKVSGTVMTKTREYLPRWMNSTV